MRIATLRDDSDDEEDDSDDEEGGDENVGVDDDANLSEGEEQVSFSFPDIGMGVDGTRAQGGFSGSFDDDISIPHARAASSPSGSPIDRSSTRLRARLNLLSRWLGSQLHEQQSSC